MRFPSDDELMAGPNAFGDARIEVAPDAADPEADARAQIEAGLGETSDEAGAESGDDADAEDLRTLRRTRTMATSRAWRTRRTPISTRSRH